MGTQKFQICFRRVTDHTNIREWNENGSNCCAGTASSCVLGGERK